MLRYWILLGLSILFFSCSNKNKKDKLLAEVHGRYLYESELHANIPPHLNQDDSLLFRNNFIRKWVENQLIIDAAKMNLIDGEENIEKRIEEYRNALLIHQYKQKLIEQKMDTVISENEIQAYYEQFPDNFILKQNVIKALFIKLPLKAPNLENCKKWAVSEEEEDHRLLEDYCFMNAEKFDTFDDKWIYCENIEKELPQPILYVKWFFETISLYETKDSASYYLLKINDFKLKNSTAPIQFVKDEIKEILLHKRKINFAKQLEQNIYNDAKKKKEFKIY